MRTQFDAEKAVEAILYIANRLESPTFHTISKVFYFADKEHITRYGRFITGDDYVAMKNGPVPSATYDILKYVRGDRTIGHAEHARSLFSINHRYYVATSRDADLDEFSDSDLECLNESLASNGSLTFQGLTDKSHDKVYDAADRDDFIPVDAFIDEAEDPEFLKEHFYNPAF